MSEEFSCPRTTWVTVGSGLHCPAAVARQSSSSVDLFAREATGELLHSKGDATGWREWRSLGLPVGHTDGSRVPVGVDWQVAACSGSPDRIDLFARTPDGDLLHMTQTGDAWSAFEVLGSPAAITRDAAIPMGLASPPAVCSRGPEQIDVFALGSDGGVLHTAHNNARWSGFESLGMPTLRRGGIEQPSPLSGPLAACACGPTHMGSLPAAPGGTSSSTGGTGRAGVGLPRSGCHT
jgi:hypothetical protein